MFLRRKRRGEIALQLRERDPYPVAIASQ